MQEGRQNLQKLVMASIEANILGRGYLQIACSVNRTQCPFEVVLVQTSTKQVIREARQQGSVANR